MTNKSITVSIPSFNSQNFIKETIKSILQQTRKVDKIIVCDDCSTDKTKEIIKIFKNNKHLNIKFYTNEQNLGYQKNWNKCLEKSTSAYTLILHADDMLKSNTIEKQIKFLQENPEIALVGGYEDFIDENGKLIRKNKNKKTNIYKKGEIYEFVKNHGSYIACSSVLFNMEKIKQVGFFDERYLATDELYWPKVLSQFPIAVLGESLIYRRVHPGQTEYSDFTKKYDKIIEASYAQYKIAEYEKEPLRQKATLRILKEKTARNCIRIALKVFQINKDISTSLKYLKVSFKEYPKIFLSKFFIKFIIKTVLGKIH